MPSLDHHPDLAAIQRYVAQLEEERGFCRETATQKCLLMGEEMGELFRAVRKNEGLGVDANSHDANVAHELADMLIYLCSIANRYQVSLEQAFRDKEEINKRRTWKSDQ